MSKVFAYLRVSGRSQVRGDGFLRQFIAIRKFCEANGHQIVKIFREKGVGGARELEDRPALSDLFGALEENGVKSIVVEKLDRLARDLMVQETIVADMQRSGYTLLSTCEPDLCSTDPSRVLVRQIFGAIAQYEKQMLVLKLRGARDRKKARNGKCGGRHSFGEKPEEERALQEIFLLRDAGNNTAQIAELLNVRRFKTRSGQPWRPTVVAKIVKRHQSSR